MSLESNRKLFIIAFKNMKRVTTIAITIVGRMIALERAISKKSKELIPKVKQRRLRAITLQQTINKSLILLSQ